MSNFQQPKQGGSTKGAASGILSKICDRSGGRMTLEIRKALITGASAGLGEEFARQLAASGTDLILTARRKDRLEALAADLEKQFGISVEIIPADLVETSDIERLEKRIAETPDLDLLINNAGFGRIGRFATRPIEPSLEMTQVHIVAFIRLARVALAGMLARNRGALINVSSIAAFSTLSGAVYSSTKNFQVMFSLNLQNELRGTDIRIQALCPGFTHTEFHQVMGMDKSAIPAFMWMTAEKVVRVSLRSLRRRRKVVCIPGFGNRLNAFLMRCPTTAALIHASGRLAFIRKKLID
jgi:uncharacterized protein